MITLNKYSSVILLANLEFYDYEYVPQYRKYILEDGITDINNIKMKRSRLKLNPNYPYRTKQEERIARYKNEKKRREFIIKYLEEFYGDTDYSEKYASSNKWNLPLRLHNDRSLKCEYLNDDRHHCNLRHKSGCYTCCFECKTPDLCEWSNCELLK